MTRDSELDLLLQKSRANAPLIERQLQAASPRQRRKMLEQVMSALDALPPEKRQLAEEAIRREMARKGLAARVSLGKVTSGWDFAGQIAAVVAQIGVTVYAMEHDKKMASRRSREENQRAQREMEAYEAHMEQERAARAAQIPQQKPASPGGIDNQKLLIGGAAVAAVAVIALTR